MILIFDYFETIALTKVMDFNLGLRPFWEKYYKDKCSFEEIAEFGQELYVKLQEFHKKGLEYPFVKDELPEYAAKYGGEVVNMTVEEEAEFLMLCNVMENMPHIPEALEEFSKLGISMYVLSNSGFTAEALAIILERLGISKYFKKIWSSADYGKIKPSREFFEMAINQALSENPTERKEDIVFVGDTYNTDVKGANDAGIDVIWINHKNEINKDNLVVHSINNTGDLIEVVKKMMKK